MSDQYRSLVETHARYLASHQQQRIKIEGNTDERGGAEYNLAWASAVPTRFVA